MSLVPGHLTITEVAVILDRDVSTVARYVRKGKLPSKTLGRNVLIPQKAVDQFEAPKPGNPNFRKP